MAKRVKQPKATRIVFFNQFGMMAGQIMWVEVNRETGIVTSRHSWLPCAFVGMTLEDVAFEVMREIDEWMASLNRN